MSNGLACNDMRPTERTLQYGVPVYGRAARTSFWPGLPRNLGAALLTAILIVAAGCAVQSDRTSDLVELGLADRNAAISRLEAEDRADPAAWRAYSLGVLHAAAGDYAAMDRWFALCAERGDLHTTRMAAVRREHWRRWAEAADQHFAAGRWAEAERACATALAAEAGHPDTELRQAEAAVMAHGPTPRTVAVLTAADRTAVLDRWLEAAAAGAVDAAARARVAADLVAAPTLPMGAFVLGELARLAGDHAAMARWYDATGGLLDTDHRDVMTAERRAAHHRHLAAALAAWATGGQDQCLAHLDTAAAVLPGDEATALARARAVVLDRAAGSDAVARVLSDPTLDDAWLEAWFTRLGAAGRLDEAVVVADHLLAPARNAPPDLVRRIRRARAAGLASRGHWDAAAADLRALLDGPGDEAALATALGDVLLAGSRWDDARAAFARAARAGGPTLALHKRQARAAFGAGRWHELLSHSEAALALDPADAEARRLQQQATQLAAAAGKAAP